MDIKDGRTVKGINFEGLRDAGDPVELARFYSENGADELVFLDITATQENRATLVDMARRIATEINIPFTVGGGIRSVEDASVLLKAGADKISINSSAVRNPQLINALAETFGNQCVVLAIDAKFIENEWIVQYGAEKIILGADVKDLFIATNGWLETSKISLFDFLDGYYQQGIRNVLCTDISKDGMLEGPAFELYTTIMKKFNDLDLIASGGISCIEDVKRLKSDGIPAVVIGRAIYENKIDLGELSKL